MTVDVSPATVATCFDDTLPTWQTPCYQNNLPKKYNPTVKEKKQKVCSDLKPKTVLDLKQAKGDEKKMLEQKLIENNKKKLNRRDKFQNRFSYK